MEPFERARVFADPDEFHPSQPLRRVGPGAEVVDVFQDRRPRRHADARADQHGDFVVKHVFRRRPVRAVDADLGHHLTVLVGDLVHAVGVEDVVFIRLGRPRPQGVAQRPREIPHLPDVNRDVGIEGARRDGEGMPLRGGDGGHVQEQPLPRLVRHARFLELDFQRVVRVPDHLGDLGRAARRDGPVDALRQVEPAGDQLPPPAFVSDAVGPEGIPGERRERLGGVPDEAARRVGVEPEEEGDEQVMSVPERFVGLLPDLRMRGGEHQQHAEEHHMPGDAPGVGVVDLHGRRRPELISFHIEEAIDRQRLVLAF